VVPTLGRPERISAQRDRGSVLIYITDLDQSSSWQL